MRMKAKFERLAAAIKRKSYKLFLSNWAGFTEMTLFPLFGDSKQATFATFITVSKNRVAFSDENLTNFYFLQLFYRFLAAGFFTGTNSK